MPLMQIDRVHAVLIALALKNTIYNLKKRVISILLSLVKKPINYIFYFKIYV